MKPFETTLRPVDAFGYEHEVRFPQESGADAQVIKGTYGDCFRHLPDGSETNPPGYLERLMMCNEVLADQISLLGTRKTARA